jgi:uncharacterized membrane protein YhhN
MNVFRNTPLIATVYFAALVGTIIGNLTDDHRFDYACKPLLMLVLSIWFYLNSRRYGDRFTLLVQAGLFFSWIGDIALMFQHIDQFNFLVGLGAFLLAQLCYGVAFAFNIGDMDAERGPLVPVAISIGLVIYGVLLALVVVPRAAVEGVDVPVIIYAGAITLMGVLAAFRYGRTFPGSFLLVMSGAVLFIASDSILAYSRFVKPLAVAPWAIMLTYGLAQFMIALGALRHVLDPDEIRRKSILRT